MLQKSLLTILIFTLLSCGAESPTSSNSTDTSNINTAPPQQEITAKERPENSASAHFAKDVRSIGPAMTPGQKTMTAQLSQLGQGASENDILGYYTGQFGPNRITVILTHMDGDQLEGYSVCAGNFRPLKGSIRSQGEQSFKCELEEPGDDPYDGTFTFTLSTTERELEGDWAPFRKQGNRAKTYRLAARDFKYNPAVGEWPEASQRLLSEEDVWNYNSEELRLMRNEIYARHGYSFKIKDMRYHFEDQDWYMPVTTDIRTAITDIEVQNIELIYEYETYYEEYYDDFGR